MLREILEDRKNLEQQYGTLARGMAYPYGTYCDSVIDALSKCGICYSRTVHPTERFGFPQNWLTLHPTCHHNNPKLMELAKNFAENVPDNIGKNWMFYLWGHSFEFDGNNNWEVIENFAEYIGGREDIWYATNIEIYDYVMAYEQLRVSVDRSLVYNPTAIKLWFAEKGKTYCVAPDETLII